MEKTKNNGSAVAGGKGLVSFPNWLESSGWGTWLEKVSPQVEDETCTWLRHLVVAAFTSHLVAASTQIPAPRSCSQHPPPDPCLGQSSPDPAGSLTRDTTPCPLIPVTLTIPSQPSPYSSMPSNIFPEPFNEALIRRTICYFHTMCSLIIEPYYCVAIASPSFVSLFFKL